LLLVLFSVLRIFVHPLLLAPIMGSHVSGCMAANRLIETVIAPNFCLRATFHSFRPTEDCVSVNAGERSRRHLLAADCKVGRADFFPGLT
jgi:hypothetical protein